MQIELKVKKTFKFLNILEREPRQIFVVGLLHLFDISLKDLL